MSPSAFGYQALGDFGFVRGLRAGRSPRLKTVERVQTWMSGYDRQNPNPKRERRKAEDEAVAQAARAARQAMRKRGAREASAAT